MPAKNYASTRFSELDQINAGNVARLAVAFTFSTGVNRGQEAAPLVVLAWSAACAADTVYVSDEQANVVHVIDGASGRLLGAIDVGRRPRGMSLAPDTGTCTSPVATTTAST